MDETWSQGERAADLVVAATLAAPVVLLGFGSPDGATYAADLTEVLESAAVAGLLTQIAKTAVGRPYPYMLRPAPYAEQNRDGDNYASFWSGHTAVPMAAAVDFAWRTHRRHPRSPWRWVAWAVGPALAITAGALQTTASNHYPTDVAVGALAGAAVGAMNGWIHDPPERFDAHGGGV